MNNRIQASSSGPTAIRMVSLFTALLINAALAIVFLYGGQSDMYQAPVAQAALCSSNPV